MSYVILITFSISQCIQAGLAIYLFIQFQKTNQYCIENAYAPMGNAPQGGEYAIPSAPTAYDCSK